MERRVLDLPTGSIPAVIFHPDPAAPDPDKAKKLVLLFHGLGVAKEIQVKELQWLADAGYTAVTVDAPHHGERRTPFLDQIDREPDSVKRHAMVIDLVRQAAAEIPHLISFFVGEGYQRIAVSGISLGGYTAFGSILHTPRPDALVPVLASPDWGAGDSPHQHLTAFASLPTLAIVGRKDTVVPPGPCRELFAALAKKYKKATGRLALHEYPESGHFMREEDWNDAWKQIIAFLDRFL